VSFSGVRKVIGGTQNDTFKITSGNIDIDGGGGTNTLDYSGVTLPNTSINVNLQSGSADLHVADVIVMASTFQNIQSLVGNGNSATTLTGTNAATTWSISGLNSGTAGTFSFTAVPNLAGGSATNKFVFSNG